MLGLRSIAGNVLLKAKNLGIQSMLSRGALLSAKLTYNALFDSAITNLLMHRSNSIIQVPPHSLRQTLFSSFDKPKSLAHDHTEESAS